MKKRSDFVFKAALVLYAALMIYLLFFERMGDDSAGTYFEKLSQNINIIPFRTIRRFIRVIGMSQNDYLVRFSFVNLVGNIVMFVPLGFLIPMAFEKMRMFKKTIALSLVTIIVVEIIQLFTLLGVCDIDDLIFNILGVLLGYGFYALISKPQK